MDPIQDKSIPSDRTIKKYAISFNLEGHPFKFLLKKPSVESAFLAILEMWSHHSRFSLMLAPK